MRLHHLTVTAFGPFPGTEAVDFDELNEAGLFLLTGPTGAGKTSLLDAVCFALYGTVPGVREVRALRSQHAAGDVAPEVVLDFSVQGRRFVVRRRPEWSRPKRRGTGVTTDKASASIIETTGGGDHFLSARAAEVGLLIGDLMGMTAGQFTQVALLPQGEFQTFLRASSQDRHDVLQQLFRTDRFARIEEWVADHSRLLRDEAESGRVTVQRLLDTVADRAGVATPEELSGEDLAAAAAEGRTLPWVTDLVTVAEAEAGLAAGEHRAASIALTAARDRLARESRRAELRERRDGARAALTALEESAGTAELARRRLQDHDRALRCQPVAELAHQAAAEMSSTGRRLDRAVDALRSSTPATSLGVPGAEGVLALLADGPEATVTAVAGLVDAARRRAAVLEALLPRERAAAEARRQRDESLVRLDRAQTQLLTATERATRLPALLAATESSRDALGVLAVRRHALAGEVSAARTVRDAAVELVPARERLRVLEDVRRDLRDGAQDARERLQGLVARRLAGMAAELAGDLADGDPCQVCGSTEHPLRAEPADDAVTDADQTSAEAALAVAQARFEAADLEAQQARRDHDALEVAGAHLTPDDAAGRLAAVTLHLAEAVAAEEEQTRLEEQLRDLRAEQLAVGEQQSRAAATAAGLRESAAAHQRTVDAVRAEVAQALGERTPSDADQPADGDQPAGGDQLAGGDSVAAGHSVASTLQALTGWCELLVEARDALSDQRRARVHRDEAVRRAADQAAAQGFTDAEAVTAAVLEDQERLRLEASLRDRDASAAHAQAVLEDPALAELGDGHDGHDGHDGIDGRHRGDGARGSCDDREPDLLDLVLELTGGRPSRADETAETAEAAEADEADEAAESNRAPGSEVSSDRTQAAGVAEEADLLARLADECAVAETTADGTARATALRSERVTALRDLHDRVQVALEGWSPVRDRSLRAESMAQLVKGRGHDNQLQMRLSAYVLATRLDQVVAAANERLGQMRDHRYVLQRTGRAERRGTQAGLGLEVVDQWTGDTRSPSSLSGGETFVVSLSLALGLADVVTHEAGGTEIETLFVDEGFGTLDADTLDDVMDRLDSLRAGGRTVGVVSHVTELRDRIPTQVQVDKGRHGSSVSVRTLVG